MNGKAKRWTWEESGTRVVRSIARTGPGCHQGCGVLLYVKDGKLVKVDGDPEFPLSQGRLCPRCLALTQVVYHPDRLKYPLRRVGERGDGKWKRITWEEAYDTIVAKFTQIKGEYGAESVTFCDGTGRDIRRYLARLCYSFGSPNMVGFAPLNGLACYAPRVATMSAIMGSFAVADCAQSFPDRYENPNWKVPECIIMWGNQLFTSPDGFLGHWIIDCMKRGAKIIVVDPRKVWLATRAKIWMQIRPGTDAALALGMSNVIINEKLYDKEFARRWTYGFDKLEKRVQEYPPEKVAEITWIPKDLIVKAARMYANSKPAAIQWGEALDQSKECITTLHAIIALWTLTGNLDVPGGNIIRGRLFDLNKSTRNWGAELITEEQRRKAIGLGMYPFLDWSNHPSGEALIDQIFTGKPYPVKAAWIQTTNTFVCGTADPKKVYEAFRKLDFNVVVDLFMTPTAVAFADIVLPAATYAERDGVAIPVGCVTGVGTINKAIEPVGECKSDMQINFELGKRLNPEAWPWDNVQEMFSEMIKTTGMTFEELREAGWTCDTFEYKKYEKGLLRPDKQPGFNTPTGKVELYSTVLERCGLNALPYFEEPPESPFSTPELAEEYPLVLTTGARAQGLFHSEHRQIPLLRELHPDPITEIHPETAEKLGIRDGDWIIIENNHGRCKQRAKLTSGIHPRVINSQHGWWFPEKPGQEPKLFGAWESNINLLLPSGWTGKSGFGYPFKNQICRVYKLEKE